MPPAVYHDAMAQLKVLSRMSRESVHITIYQNKGERKKNRYIIPSHTSGKTVLRMCPTALH